MKYYILSDLGYFMKFYHEDHASFFFGNIKKVPVFTSQIEAEQILRKLQTIYPNLEFKLVIQFC